MQKCLDCLEPVAINCIKPELKLSFEYDGFEDLLKQLDKSQVSLNKTLTKAVDKKWITSEKTFVTDYIQDIINKIDVLTKVVDTEEQTYTIQSGITGSTPKTLFQLLTILVKEVDALKNKTNSTTSSLYIQNV